MNQAIELFQSELSVRVGRSATDLLIGGLETGDFPPKGAEIHHQDGSRLKLRNALVVENATHVGVFTEHLGYFVFHKEDLLGWHPAG